MQIAVCDDNKDNAAALKRILVEECRDNQIDIFNNGQELLASKQLYDVLFLDIDMPGKNGIEVAREIRCSNKRIPIVYVTAYEDYTHLAFSVHAFGYIIKPFNKEMVSKQIQDIREYLAITETSASLRFETLDGITVMDIKDIYYFEYENRKTVMVTTTGRTVLRMGINQTTARMKDFGFDMPHKSFCVNLYYVRTIKGYDIHMMNGSVIPLSQKKSPQFRRKLLQYQADCLIEKRG